MNVHMLWGVKLGRIFIVMNMWGELLWVKSVFSSKHVLGDKLVWLLLFSQHSLANIITMVTQRFLWDLVETENIFTILAWIIQV